MRHARHRIRQVDRLRLLPERHVRVAPGHDAGIVRGEFFGQPAHLVPVHHAIEEEAILLVGHRAFARDNARGDLGFHKPVLRQIGLRKVVINRHQAAPVRRRVCAAVIRASGIAFQRAGLLGVACKLEGDLGGLFQGSLRLDRLTGRREDICATPLQLRHPALPRVEGDVVFQVLGSLVEIRHHCFCLIHRADRQVGTNFKPKDRRQHQAISVFL